MLRCLPPSEPAPAPRVVRPCAARAYCGPGSRSRTLRARVVAPPAEAGLVWLRRERRARKAAPPEAAGCTPRGRGRSDHRDGTAKPGTGAAHVPDPARTCPRRTRRCRGPAVVVGLEQPADAAEAGGLEVEHARWPWQCLDVANRVDRLVPRDPVSVAVEQLDGVVGHRGILDPCPRQPLEYATVEVGVRVHGHGRVAVVTLHVDHVDAGERRQLCEKVVIPACGGIELETQTRDPFCAVLAGGRGWRGHRAGSTPRR